MITPLELLALAQKGWEKLHYGAHSYYNDHMRNPATCACFIGAAAYAYGMGDRPSHFANMVDLISPEFSAADIFKISDEAGSKEEALRRVGDFLTRASHTHAA
jgi:hypothetical protein